MLGRVPPHAAAARPDSHVQRDVGRQRGGHQIRGLGQQPRGEHIPRVRRCADVEDVGVGAGHRGPLERPRRHHARRIRRGVDHRRRRSHHDERNVLPVSPHPADARAHPHVERAVHRQHRRHQVRGPASTAPRPARPRCSARCRCGGCTRRRRSPASTRTHASSTRGWRRRWDRSSTPTSGAR